MPTKKVIKKSALSPTVLIAGGAGFVGSYLAETLLLKDSRVIVLDNFKTGKQNYVNHLISNPKFALYDVDINNGLPEEIESVDYVFHLAGLEEYQSELNLDSLLTNAIGTKHLLDLAKKSSAKFVLASSIYVYHGMMSQLNLEQYFGKTTFEEGKYSLSEAKRYAEALVWEYYKKYDSDVRIVRLPEVYGPKMDLSASGDLGRFLQDLRDGKDLTVYGDGTEKEFYLYINDAISGIIKSVFTDKTKGRIYSLVSTEPYSVLEISYLLRSVADRGIKIEFKPKEENLDRRSVVPDLSSLKDLDWEAKTSLREGVLKTLNWLGYDSNPHSFKPGKLIEEKRKEKAGEQVETLAGINEFPGFINRVDNPPAKFPDKSPDTISSFGFSPVDIRDTKPEKPKEKRELHLPRPHIQLWGIKSKKIKIILSLVLAAFLYTSLFLIGLPAFQAYSNLKSAESDIKKVPLYLGQVNSPEAQASAESSFQHFYKGGKAFNRLQWAFNLAGKKDLFNSLSSSLSSAAYFSRATYYFSKSSVPVSSLWETIRPDSDKVFDKEGFEKAKSDFLLGQNNLQLAQAEFKGVNPELFKGNVRKAIDDYKKVLDTASANMDLASASFSGLSGIIGVEEPKKYLILFQNSSEIRPTGGFIGSYALLELKDGKISSLTIDDIYNPDGQIDLRNIKVPSPAPVAKLLKEPNLHLRNANWNPDFTQSSRDIQDLYYKVTGEKVDGVIALDLTFAKNILEVTGPVFLTAYNEEISSNNLFERAEYHSEFNYTEGSDNKRSFLTVLGSKLLEKMFALQNEKLPELWKEVYKSLDEKHLLIQLNNSTFGAYLEKEGWDGSLARTDGDYLYVVNANLGGTKANYFVTNEMNYEIISATRDGVLRGVSTLKYNHTGVSDSWPDGPYTNYVRVLTPSGTKLTGATIQYGGKEAVDTFKTIVIAKVGNYNSFETNFTLNPKDNVTLTFSYDLAPNTTITKENNKYSLYWQKQPGTDNDKMKFTFNAPFGLKSNISTVEGTLNTDKQFSVVLDPQ